MITAVLLDTVAIQKYVFASNRLKENLGASQLVENIYKNDLKDILEQITGSPVDMNDWENCPNILKMKDNPTIECEIGYVGGGNALVFFRRESTAKEFIGNWTRMLLVNAPGLQTAIALSPFNLDNLDVFKNQLTSLHLRLNENKNKYFPNTVLTKHGITADCPLSGHSAEVYHFDVNDEKNISSVSKAKLDAAKISQDTIRKNFKDILVDKFDFTSEIDKLGQKKGENHIAIVHVDGNGMGKRFENCSSPAEIRSLSFSIASATHTAFALLLQYVIENINFLTAKDSGFSIRLADNKLILPVRPIVLAGDDITFVTDGRLGVHFAEKFIQYWTEQNASDGKPLSASAGVAVIKSKYPFYRGYKLAEELCASAKKSSRKKNNKSCLDFYFAVGGFSGTLEQIREKHFKVNEGELYFGPYLLGEENRDDEKSIFKLKQGIKYFSDKSKWPRNKVKDFRSNLPLGKYATRQFIEDLHVRGITLPESFGSYSDQGWENSSTPYFDMIELMEFYPPFFIEDN